MKIVGQIPQQIKIGADVAAPATAGAYMFGWLPSTWGEWAACMAGLWAFVQISNFVWEKYKAYKAKRRG